MPASSSHSVTACSHSELLADRFDSMMPRQGDVEDRIRHAAAANITFRAGQDGKKDPVDAVGYRIDRHLEPAKPLLHAVLRVPAKQTREDQEPLLVGQFDAASPLQLTPSEHRTPFLLLHARKLVIRGSVSTPDASQMVYAVDPPAGASAMAAERVYRAQLADKADDLRVSERLNDELRSVDSGRIGGTAACLPLSAGQLPNIASADALSIPTLPSWLFGTQRQSSALPVQHTVPLFSVQGPTVPPVSAQMV